jgi:hypothetical protein
MEHSSWCISVEVATNICCVICLSDLFKTWQNRISPNSPLVVIEYAF